MSGRKQHFIPQSLLRAFGKKGNGAKVQVTVYDRQRGVFVTATDGIAAERHFYSELQVEGGDPTLDDRITGYETPLSVALARCRDAAPGSDVDPALAAEIVTHLTIRNAHLRESLDGASGRMLEEIHGIFADRDRSRRVMGLDLHEPSGVILEEIDKIWTQVGPIVEQHGMTKDAFYAFAFSKMQEIFEANFGEQRHLIGQIMSQLQEKRPSLVRNAHNNVLGNDLAPPARVEVMRTFHWRVLTGPEEGFVLPDCVAVASVGGSDHRPLIFAERDEIDGVYMPLSSGKVLVGERGGGFGLPASVNELSAKCSWDFFVASNRTPQFESYQLIIGDRVRRVLDEAIDDALKDHR